MKDRRDRISTGSPYLLTDEVIGIRTAVPHKPPRLPDPVIHGEIQGDGENLLTMPCPSQNRAECITDKGSPEEPDIPLAPGPVDSSDMHAVCNGMTPLDRLPGILPGTFGGSVFHQIPDSGRVDDQVCTHQGDRPRRLGEPLIITDERSDPAKPGLTDTVSGPGSKISLLKEAGILGDMDLRIRGEDRPVSIDDQDGVLQDPTGGPLKDGDDDDNPGISRYPGEGL